MSQSDRAEGRLRDLRDNVLDKLHNHTALTDHIERAAGVDDATGVIRASPRLDMWHRSDGMEPPDVAVGIKAVTENSSRENRQERKLHVVQSDLQMREDALRTQGVAWPDDINDEIGAVLTSHDVGWTAGGATGGTPEPLWDEDLNRYRSVTRYDIEHWG